MDKGRKEYDYFLPEDITNGFEYAVFTSDSSGSYVDASFVIQPAEQTIVEPVLDSAPPEDVPEPQPASVTNSSSWIDIRVAFDHDDPFQAYITISRSDPGAELDNAEFFLLIDAEEDIELIPDEYYDGFAIG